MANVNVNRAINDMFYRYKMPLIITKSEGKGNGKKTIIVNANKVAKALYRPAINILKYFGCKLGSQVQFEQKLDRYIIKGAHDAVQLQNLLDGYIRKYVLCPVCENPETVVVLQGKRVISITCKACGYSGRS